MRARTRRVRSRRELTHHHHIHRAFGQGEFVIAKSMRAYRESRVENDAVLLQSHESLQLLRAGAVADHGPQDHADQDHQQYPENSAPLAPWLPGHDGGGRNLQHRGALRRRCDRDRLAALQAELRLVGQGCAALAASQQHAGWRCRTVCRHTDRLSALLHLGPRRDTRGRCSRY